jgi:hypothetical protein
MPSRARWWAGRWIGPWPAGWQSQPSSRRSGNGSLLPGWFITPIAECNYPLMTESASVRAGCRQVIDSNTIVVENSFRSSNGPSVISSHIEQNAETAMTMMCCEIEGMAVRLSYHADESFNEGTSRSSGAASAPTRYSCRRSAGREYKGWEYRIDAAQETGPSIKTCD